MGTDHTISRRSALKRMGLAMAGALMSSTGLLSLTSCGKKDMPPNMVRQFIRKARLKADYKYTILTYGNRKCNAVEIWDNISRQAGVTFDHINTIIIVDNWLPNFDMNEQMLIDKHIPENLEKISADIASRKQYCMPCPYGLDIPGIFSHFNKCINEGNVPPSTQSKKYRRARQAFLIGYDRSVPRLRQANHCIGCRRCVDHCPQNIDIPSQIQRIDNFVEQLKQNPA